jgi:hypothetical protein
MVVNAQLGASNASPVVPSAQAQSNLAQPPSATTASTTSASGTTAATAPGAGGYDPAAADAHMSRFRYSEEGAQGTQLTESIAMMELNGGRPDLGTDGALNCNQATAEAQAYFRGQNPPVNTEIVVADGHSVLRMPDGQYYDPSRAMQGGPGGSSMLSAEEAQPYQGLNGVTVADREQIASEVRSAVAGLPQDTPSFVRTQLAIGAANMKAQALREGSALAFANGTDGAPAPLDQTQAEAEVARAESQAAQANAANDPQAAEAAANRVLEAKQRANEAVRQQGAAPPYPEADLVTDAVDASRLPVEQQTKLFGAPLSIPPEVAIARDRQALANAQDPAAAALELGRQLEHASPEYREQLLATQEAQTTLGSLATWVPETAEGMEQYQRAVDGLVRVGDTMGVEQARLLTDPIARAWENEGMVNEPLTNALRSAMHQTPSAVLGLALEQSFLAAGKEGPAINIQNFNHEVLRAIDAEFDSVSEDVDAAQQELYTYLEEFGPAMTAEEQQAAIDNHMRANQELYSRWERLGGAMSTSMTALGSLGATAEDHPYAGRAFEMTESLPMLGMTKAGSQYLEDAISRQSNDEVTLLELAQHVDKANGWGDKVATMLVAATSRRASALVEAGDIEGARRVIDELKLNKGLLQVDGAAFDDVINTLNGLLDSRPGVTAAQAQAELEQTFRNIDAKLGLDPSHPVSRALKGLGVGLGVVGAYQGLVEMEDPSFEQFVTWTIENGQLGADGMFAAMELMGRPVSEAAKAWTGRVFGALGVGLDGWRAFQEWQKGDYAEAGSHATMAVGGAILLLAGSNPAGIMVGTGLVLIGGLAKMVFDSGDAEREAREKFLKGAGVPEAAIPTLVNAEPGRIEELRAMGFNYEQLITLAQSAPTLFTESEGEAGTLQGIEELQRQFGLSGDQLYGLLDTVIKANPEDPAAAVGHFVMNAGGVGQGGFMPTTREGWIQKYQEQLGQLDPHYDAEQIATLNSVISYLQSLP